jgi:regulatory protein
VVSEIISPLSNNSETKPDPSPRNKGLDLLSRREHSVAELRAKLVVREFDLDAIDVAIETLVHDGLLSDDRFAAAYVSSRIRKGQGPIRIRGELKKRGVADELIAMHLERADVDWARLASNVRHKKYGSTRSAEYLEQARQSRFLQYRGFTGEQIRAAMGSDYADDDYAAIDST